MTLLEYFSWNIISMWANEFCCGWWWGSYSWSLLHSGKWLFIVIATTGSILLNIATLCILKNSCKQRQATSAFVISLWPETFLPHIITRLWLFVLKNSHWHRVYLYALFSQIDLAPQQEKLLRAQFLLITQEEERENTHQRLNGTGTHSIFSWLWLRIHGFGWVLKGQKGPKTL